MTTSGDIEEMENEIRRTGAGEFTSQAKGSLNESPEALAGKMARKIRNNAGNGLATIKVAGGGLWELWAAATDINQSRLNRYRDYDEMGKDSLLQAALELYTDDACQFSLDKGATVWPAKGSDEQWVQQQLDRFDIENKVWGWAFNLAKYGDMFLKLNIEKGKKVEKSEKKSKGGEKDKSLKITSLDESIHPKEVRRIDMNGELAGFLTAESITKIKVYDPWDFIHFVLSHKPQFERHKLKMKGKVGGRGKDVTVTSLYGSSILDPARQVFRVLKLMEQALALARLNRAPLVRVFYVNTTGMTPEERSDSMDLMERQFKENLAIDLRKNFYKSDFNPMNFSTDIFIPITGDKGDVRAESLGGDMNIKDLADIDYHRNKLFAALRVPAAYLGFEECLRASTRVRLADGTSPTIDDIANDRDRYLGRTILTCSAEGDISATRIAYAKKTRRNATFVRVHLDDGASFDVTPDHKCMMKDGTFREAGDIVDGDFLMSKHANKGTSEIRDICPDLIGNPVDLDVFSLQVVRVESLDIIEDAYDIGVESPNHTFLLDAGVFVHNSMPGALGSTTLVRLDIRYARSVKKVQRAVIAGLRRFLEVVWAIERNERPTPEQVGIEMEVISGVEELDRLQGFEQKVSVASSFLNLLVDLEGKINPEPLINYVFSDILGLKSIIPDLDIGKTEPPAEGEEEDIFSAAAQAEVRKRLEERLKDGKLDGSILQALHEAKGKSMYFRKACTHRDKAASLPGDTLSPIMGRIKALVKEPEEE